MGVMCAAGEVRKVLSLWTAWEVVTGSKLGIKAMGKTVLTRVWYDAFGRARDVVNPKLATAYGMPLPFIYVSTHERHLQVSIGRYLEVGARTGLIWDVAWVKLSGKLDAGLARLRSLHKPSLRELCVVSEAILNRQVAAA